MSNINEWLSVDMMEGEGNYNVTLTASAYNGANNRTTRIAVIGKNKTKYVNIIQLKEGDVEIPTDVVNCFYISPTTIAGTEVMVDNGYIFYFVNNEWRRLDANTPITINKRTYFKDFTKTYGATLSLKGLCNVGGNIETLLGKMKYGYSAHLFSESDIVDASNLILPSMIVDDYGYRGMFEKNKYLIKTPTLPATTIGERSYENMFNSCTSLVTAPSLPATTLNPYCYSGIFEGCTSLVNTPTLPATELAEACYWNMFKDCKSLVVAPLLPATTLVDGCYQTMFYGCSSLATPPTLSATTLAGSCYASMFYGCINLRTAPVLPATTLANSCYSGMFGNCTSLVNAPTLPATTLAEECYRSMFYGCTNLEIAPILEATILKRNCYAYMFYGCSKLNYIKMLATTLYGVEGDNDFSLRGWVNGVAEYGTFVKHPDMDSLTKGINGIPTLWVIEDDERFYRFDVDVENIDMTDNLTATITVSSNTNWSVEYNSDWFSVSPINGNGDGSITVTADEYNDINRSSIIYFTMNDRIVDSVRVYQEYINTDVEVPTDIENCFYIEPIEGSLKVGNNYSGNSTAYVRYYENGMWNDLVRSSTPNLTIRKKTYFSYGKFSAVFITDKKFNIGGRISTITGIPTSSLPSIGKAPKFKDTKVVDASNLILDVNPLTFEWGTNKDGCYESMFENCIELLNPPLQITYTGGTNCCERMFYGCINMQYAPRIINTDTDYYGILNFERMFYGCSKIKVVYINIQEVRPEMFMSMFQYCEQLREVILTPPNLGNSSDYVDWLKGVSATGIIYKIPNATLPDGVVPEGWEVRDYEG